MLGKDPEVFGRWLVGDVIDAYIARREYEAEQAKTTAGLIRAATTILVNLQLDKHKKVTQHELWPFPWDEEDGEDDYRSSVKAVETINELKKKRAKDGNGNIQP